jgi:hypothetical protein
LNVFFGVFLITIGEIKEKPLLTIPEKPYQNLPDFLQRATARVAP